MYDLACKGFWRAISLATYSLFATEERKALLKQIEGRIGSWLMVAVRSMISPCQNRHPGEAAPLPHLPSAKIQAGKNWKLSTVREDQERD